MLECVPGPKIRCTKSFFAKTADSFALEASSFWCFVYGSWTRISSKKIIVYTHLISLAFQTYKREHFWKNGRDGTFFIPSGRRWEEQMACRVCGSSSLVMWGMQLLISQCHGQSRSTVDLGTDMLGSELALCDFCSLTHWLNNWVTHSRNIFAASLYARHFRHWTWNIEGNSRIPSQVELPLA